MSHAGPIPARPQPPDRSATDSSPVAVALGMLLLWFVPVASAVAALVLG